jgi:aminodeoxyfutalosine deaminase
VVFSRGVIQAAGPASDTMKKYPSHRVYSFKNAVLMPGLINLHSHLELPALLNSIRAETFPGWVLNLISAKKKLDLTDYRNAASRNIQALLETGTTTIGEICTHNVSPALLKRSGLRALIYREIISMNPSSKMPLLSSAFSRSLSDLIRAGISPHAPHTVSELILRNLGDIARRKKLPLCMHVAESKDEIMLLRGIKSEFEKLYGAAGWDRAWAPFVDSPFAYLQGLGLLSPDFLAVHAVQATAEDIHILKRAGAPVVHCPRSNKETGVGRMPLKKFLDAGVIVGLGTDSLASVPTLNMWDEMRYAYRIHRRDGITAEDIFYLATIGGAKALGLDKEIGTIERGKKADIIAVPLPNKNTGDLYSDLLRETKSCIMTMVNGKILFNEG